MKQTLIQSAQQAGRPLDVGGFQITVLAPVEQTGGYELFRIAGPGGTGPGPHHHAWDESFFVLGGTVHCGVDGVETLASAGALIHVPGGCTHWFRFAEGALVVIGTMSKLTLWQYFHKQPKRVLAGGSFPSVKVRTQK
ncbi:MAG: cupin domain-containing protein [Comamonadaceae bacterium]